MGPEKHFLPLHNVSSIQIATIQTRKTGLLLYYPIRSTRYTKVRHYWPMLSHIISIVLKQIDFFQTLMSCLKISGNDVSLSIYVHQAIQPEQSLVKNPSKNYLSSQTSMILLLLQMNVIQKYILMKMRLPWVYFRPLQIWDEMITSVVLFFIAFQSDQMSPECDLVL